MVWLNGVFCSVFRKGREYYLICCGLVERRLFPQFFASRGNPITIFLSQSADERYYLTRKVVHHHHHHDFGMSRCWHKTKSVTESRHVKFKHKNKARDTRHLYTRGKQQARSQRTVSPPATCSSSTLPSGASHRLT